MGTKISRPAHKITSFIILLFLPVAQVLFAQTAKDPSSLFWQTNALLTPFRVPLPSDIRNIRYLDLDGDGDPDILQALINGHIPVQWIDDDDDMQQGDLEGDTDSDCLMIDMNGDGKYGGALDLIIDWNDEDGNGQADIQVLVENSRTSYKGKWKSHIVYVFDTDHDGIFNYVDWQKFRLEAWDHKGRCRFYQDYLGQSMMLKTHISTFAIHDLRYNWENPFLFFDKDDDGLTEMAIRLVDEPQHVRIEKKREERHDGDRYYTFDFSRHITLAQMTFDLDDDNAPDNEFDYDMSLQYAGEGFSYSDKVHRYKSLRGLPATDTCFYDPRWRQLSEMVFCDHDQAWPAIFGEGRWSSCWMVFDEDDDCQRWERVEFYKPLDPFSCGAGKGGLDDNPQADVSGDRGEWDEDFSGGGNLYISPLDGKIHLYGAEKGYWRIDQMARYYQGWQGWRGVNIQPQDLVFEEPAHFATVRYEDTDGNGFFDAISYDMDGDHHWEKTVRLADLGITDTARILVTGKLGYTGLQQMFRHLSSAMWERALQALSVAERYQLNTSWYDHLKKPASIQEKYFFGYWLNWYIYNDLMHLAGLRHDKKLARRLTKAYYSSNWSLVNHEKGKE